MTAHPDPLLGAAIVLLALLSALTLYVYFRSGKARLDAHLRHTNDELGRLATVDPLTGLANRLMLDTELARICQRAHTDGIRVGVLYIDLDGFRPINDAFGHLIGDDVLREVAERLRACVRDNDLVARLAGDEFVIVSSGVQDAEAAGKLAQRVVDAMAQPMVLGSLDIELSASIGVAVCPDDGDARRVLASADAAMHAAKRGGRNTWRSFSEDMNDTSPAQIRLQRDIRRGLENNEFVLYYQPKVDAASGQLIAVEALIRWRHPKRGLVAPGEFIPVAERFGLINALGNWTLGEACRQMRCWLDAGHNIPVAVNLSPQQFRQPDLLGKVRGALEEHKVPPHMLTLEITESSAMENPQAAGVIIQEMVELGVSISIDDFGTGYSCLAYLRSLPARQLKVDRSFVIDLDSSEEARAICEAVIRLAHSLKLDVVAEGVERAEQAAVLYRLGCNQLQGFLFSRPVPADDLLAFISARSAASVR